MKLSVSVGTAIGGLQSPQCMWTVYEYKPVALRKKWIQFFMTTGSLCPCNVDVGQDAAMSDVVFV